MRHLTDGTLRRLYDEPLALDEEPRAHYQACADCQLRFGQLAGDARRAAALLAVPGATVDAEAALRRVKAAAAARAPSRPAFGLARRLGWRKPAVAALLAAGLVGTLAFTSLGQSLVQIFEPTTVTPVQVSESDLNSLNALSSWGEVKQTGTTQLKEAGTAAEAAANSGGLPEIAPTTLPDSIKALPVSYGSVGQVSGSVTFNDKAPDKLRGSTLTVQVGPAEAAFYGDLSRAQSAGRQAQTPQDASSALGPTMVIVESRAPKVSSTGASVSDIKKALLAQNGLSPLVRTVIQQIDTPPGNLPIPVPAQYAEGSPVAVQGVMGTQIGDNTRLGAGVIFVKNGIAYAVGGTISKDEAIAVANSLVTK